MIVDIFFINLLCYILIEVNFKFNCFWWFMVLGFDGEIVVIFFLGKLLKEKIDVCEFIVWWVFCLGFSMIM